VKEVAKPTNITISSWNVEGRLSEFGIKKRGTADHIVSSIRKLDSDIVLLLEAHQADSIKDLTTQHKQIQEMGYVLYESPYNDDLAIRTDVYTNQLSISLLSRHKLTDFSVIRLGNLRNAIVATLSINDKSVRIIGIHLDDRSEKTRIKQIDDLAHIVNQSKTPTVVMGDFNAMHGSDLWPSKFLRNTIISSALTYIIPKLAIRAIQMATGDALRTLEANTKLTDADPSHKPTATPKVREYEWLPSIRLIQIDHIYISNEIKLHGYKIAPDGGSDHRAISATISIT
jgi:endonuclease/exonuclease/phosphatase family metal-dependent hydrolase